MKKYNTSLFLLLVLIISLPSKISFSFDKTAQLELMFRNHNINNVYALTIQCVPISAIYNNDRQLNLISTNRTSNPYNTIEVYFNNCTSNRTNGTFRSSFTINNTEILDGYNEDYKGNNPNDREGNFGAGIYKIRLWANGVYNFDQRYEELIIEIDARGGLDTYFEFYDYKVLEGVVYDEPTWFYSVTDNGALKPLSQLNGYMKSWDPYNNSSLDPPLYYANKDYGETDFIYGNQEQNQTTPNPYTELPQVCITDCSYNFGYGTKTQNQVSTDEEYSREGRIPLNTIFKKNITTRANFPQYSTTISDVFLSVEPGVKLTIGTGYNYSSSGDISFKMNPFSSSTFGNILTIKDPALSQNPITTLALQDYEGTLDYTRNSRLIIESNCKTIIEHSAKLYCGKNSNVKLETTTGFTIGGKMDWENGSLVDMKDYSQILVSNYGILTNKGASFSNNVGAEIKVEAGGIYDINNNITQTISNGGLINIDGGKLKLGDNTHLIFDGSNTKLNISSNSVFELGTNSKITFQNGAFMNTSGTNITFSSDGGPTWQGIEFNQSGNNNIQNCTFKNAEKSLYFSFDPSNANTSSYIAYNNFNVPLNTSGSYTYGIYSEDMNYVTMGNNAFTMPSTGNSVGLCMKTSVNGVNSEEENNYYQILIYNNTFNGGRLGMVLMSYASALKPYFLDHNTFNNSSSNEVDGGIAGRKIIGELKRSNFSSSKTKTDVSITQSSLKFANNNLGALFNNISATANSVIDITPVITSNDIIFDGGYNTLISSSSDNIMMGPCQSLYINNGYNCFQITGTNKHLNGVLDISGTTYDANNNYWNTMAPVYYLLNNQTIPENITLNYSQLASCQTLSLSVHQIIDRGNGLHDTIFKSQKPTNVFILPDEALYNQASTYLGNYDYPSAILNLKTLINEYPSSSYLSGALYDIYSAYQCLDTSSSQNYKDNLYSDLKTYLTDKINSNNYDYQFSETAYNFVLMCETNMQNYNDALTGYQFIALYHPDAIARLMASWDYTEVEALFSGMGGAENESISEDKYIFNLTNRLEGIISKDSTMKNLKNHYLRESSRNNSLLDAEIGSKNSIIHNKAKDKKEKDDLLIRKSVDVLMSSKNMTKEQKTQRQLEDIILVSNNGQKGKIDNNESIIPNEYSLSQNYPNPFNPVTTIRYSIPKESKVSLIVYDITGREIKSLVNDLKTAGNYSVVFNGSSFASGIYFYRLKADNFVQTKKLVLVK